MPDARTLVDQLDQFRKDQLLKRFQTLAQREYRTGDDQIDNLRVLALPDIEAAFAVCGQVSVPKPAEVKDQEEMFSDSEVSALDQLRERAKAERAADDISDDDLTKPDEGEGAE